MNHLKFDAANFRLTAILIILGALPGFAAAQGLPAEVEGTISDIVIDTAGNATVTVMGIAVNVNYSVFTSGRAKTPSATLLDPAELLNDPLPGRTSVTDALGNPVQGFIGGTAIATGTTTIAGGFVATDLYVEAAENVVLGLVTSVTSPATNFVAGSPDCEVSVEGTPVVFSSEYRTKFGTAVNGSGFEVLPCTLQAGDHVAIEGYFGDGKLYIFSLESDDADVVRTGVTTITRATCDRGKIEVRGSSTLARGTAVIKSADGAVTYDSITLTNDPITQTSIYRYRDSDAGTCPTEIRVESYDWDLTTGPLPAMQYDSFTVAPVDLD